MTCEQSHKYAIATKSGTVSPPFDSIPEAEDYKRALPPYEKPYWVAFHPVPIRQLVENPETVQSYCAEESQHIENPSLGLKGEAQDEPARKFDRGSAEDAGERHSDSEVDQD